jgi:hypothetical protein
MATFITANRTITGAIPPMNRLPTAAAPRFPQGHGALTSGSGVDNLDMHQWLRHGRPKANVMPAETIAEKHWKELRG